MFQIRIIKRKWFIVILGGIALMWFLLWMLLVSDQPTKDKFISTTEKQYLADTVLAVGSEKVNIRIYSAFIADLYRNISTGIYIEI